MKLGFGQFNPTVGDFEGNSARLLAQAGILAAEGADLALFSELCLCGYPPRDLLHRTDFVDGQLRAARDLGARLPLPSLVGLVGRVEGGDERALFNGVMLLGAGEGRWVHRKMLLPTYDVFDEARYFAPGECVEPLEFAGLRLGVLVCEDLWNDPAFFRAPARYRRDPVLLARDQGVDAVLNVSASPFWRGKIADRIGLVRHQAKRLGAPIALCNQVGATDDLIFDGSSVLADAHGDIRLLLPSFQEATACIELPPRRLPPDAATIEDLARLGDDLAQAHDALVLGLRDYVRKCGFQRVCLGMSGGIDSAVCAALAVEALGADKVWGLTMPSRFSSAGSVLDSQTLARTLRMPLIEAPIEPVVDALRAATAPMAALCSGAVASPVADENLQPRARGALLMWLTNAFPDQRVLLVNTGNKSELAVGYCTLYGDMAGGISLLGDLPKTWVYRLAAFINREREIIPRAIIDKPPSAELRFDQRDTDSLPDYEVLDDILERYVEHLQDEGAIIAAGHDEGTVRRVLDLVERNEYKRRQMPPALKVTHRAFGPGWRFPLARRR